MAGFSVGQIIGERFVLESRIGTGGIAAVFRAKDSEDGKFVAVKVLSSRVARGEPRILEELRRRFRREADLLRTLNGNPATPAFVASGETTDGDLWIAMELVQGRSLRRLVQRAGGRLPASVVVYLAGEIARGLKSIHRQRILHRDICPENLILQKNDASSTIKFIDFGFSKSLESAAPQLSQGKIVVGTPAYWSPEQVFGEELSAASDIYSVGVLLYELLTGKVPFEFHGLADAMRIRTLTPAPIIADQNGLGAPEEICHLIMAALAKNADDRPTVDEMIECCHDLERRSNSRENVDHAISSWDLSQSRPADDSGTGLLKRRRAFGPFEIRGALGVGTIGEIWHVFDSRTRREAALRVLASQDPRVTQLMDATARAARFDHPNVMRIYDSGTIDGLAYVAMQYSKSTTLIAEIAASRGGMSAGRILRISSGVLEALEHVHAAGQGAHGGCHAGNIFVDEFDNVVLSDFGLGGPSVAPDPFEVDAPRALAAPPETVFGPEISVAADLYGFGCCLYAMMTGSFPFEGPTMRVLLRHCRSPVPPIAAVCRPELPAGLAWIVEQCLMKRPDDRPASAQDVRVALRRAFKEPTWQPGRKRMVAKGFDAMEWLRSRTGRTNTPKSGS